MKKIKQILVIALVATSIGYADSGFNGEYTGVFCRGDKLSVTMTPKLEEKSTCGHKDNFKDNYKIWMSAWNSKINSITKEKDKVSLLKFFKLQNSKNLNKNMIIEKNSSNGILLYKQFIKNYHGKINKKETVGIDWLMEELQKKEGVSFHWNKTESSYTTPYGIYCNSSKGNKFLIKKYVDKRVAKTKYKKITKWNVKKVNTILQKDKTFMRGLNKKIRSFYTKSILNTIPNVLNNKRFNQTKKTYLLIAVNSNPKKATSMFNDVTSKINLNSVTDGSLNGAYVNRIIKFYSYLAYPKNSMSKPNKKYEQYFLGWINRANDCLALK